MRAGQWLVGLLLIGFPIATAVAQGAEVPPARQIPWLTIEVDASRVQIRGIISSSAHAAILEQSAHRYFADKEAVLDLQIRPALPPGWNITSLPTSPIFSR